MRHTVLALSGCLAWGLGFLPAFAQAPDQPAESAPLECQGECALPAPPVTGSPAGDHTHQRAGWPQSIRLLAVPSDTGAYVGYYVGGGAPCRGESRHANEGTWGWDYHGWLMPRLIDLGWWHGRRYQAGGGNYRTVLKPTLSSSGTP
jgi:hypothetical protein